MYILKRFVDFARPFQKYFFLVVLSGYFMYFINICGIKWINSSRNKREAYGSDIPVCVRARTFLSSFTTVRPINLPVSMRLNTCVSMCGLLSTLN
jgi:hypothetical protein